MQGTVCFSDSGFLLRIAEYPDLYASLETLRFTLRCALNCKGAISERLHVARRLA